MCLEVGWGAVKGMRKIEHGVECVTKASREGTSTVTSGKTLESLTVLRGMCE